jgi:hypothetical protein
MDEFVHAETLKGEVVCSHDIHERRYIIGHIALEVTELGVVLECLTEASPIDVIPTAHHNTLKLAM